MRIDQVVESFGPVETGAGQMAQAFIDGLAPPRRTSGIGAAIAAGAALGAAALYVGWQARRADREHPPEGRFVDVDGVRLHYVDRGEGPPLVILHGNGSLVREIELSGLPGLASRRYRTIVFDRPGFGYSERPPDTRWTPRAQASLIAEALRRLAAEQAIVVGHSWGTLVALAMALDHADTMRGLVLVGGYYFPTLRPDAWLLGAPAWPVVGPLLRWTVSPLVTRALWRPLERAVFGPAPTPERFREGIAKWRLLRPSRLRSAGDESLMMAREAARLSRRYPEITLPVAILAGERDRLVGLAHAERLHREIAGSELRIVPGVGHMLHHNVPHQVLRTIDRVARRAARSPLEEGTDPSLDQRPAIAGHAD